MSIPADQVAACHASLNAKESRLLSLAMFRSWSTSYSIRLLARDLRQTEAKTLKDIESINELGDFITVSDGNITTPITIVAKDFINSQRSKSIAGGLATKAESQRKKNIDKDQQNGTLEDLRARPTLQSGPTVGLGPESKEVSKEVSKKGNAAPPSFESKKEKPEPSPDARSCIDHLNQLSGKSFKHQMRSDLNARISENGVQPVLDVIAAKCKQWNDDSKMRPYLRPETLFNRTKFEGYLEASKSQPTPAAKIRTPEEQAAYEARLLVGLNSNGTKWSPPE